MYQIRGSLWWMWLSGGVGTIGCSLSMWNGCCVWLQQIIVLDLSISQLCFTSTPEECMRCLFFPFCASYHKTLNCRQHSLQLLFVFCFNDKWNWLDKWLCLKERSLFVSFWSKYCHKIWLSTGKMRNSMQAVKQPISVFHWIFPYKRTNALLIDWATHFPCIKLSAVWGAQFVSALVNRLKAAASP